MRRRLLVALLLVVALAIPALQLRAQSPDIWTDDLSTGTPDALTGAGTLILADSALSAPSYMGQWSRAGTYLSAVHPYEKPVGAVILDTDTTVPEGAAVRLDVRGQNADGNWQLWNEAPRGQRVVFELPVTAVQYRLALLSNGATPAARSVTVNAEWSTDNYGMLEARKAPTYRIHATREGLVGRRTANGHVITKRDRFVALPSWRSLSSQGGYEYKVRLSYKGRSVVVPVWDVGPWNTHDDYWSTNRQMWKDLDRGVPEAMAANLWGYNGGRDEFGRKPNLPNGIDIADGTFWDDLGMKDWDWVDVTFLWEGYDPGAGAGGAPAAPKAAPTPAPPPPPAAPAPEGSIVVDNATASFQAVRGTWFDGACGVGDKHRWTYSVADPGLAENLGIWKAPITEQGFYEIFAYVPACGKPATRSAQYEIKHEGGQTNVALDQEGNQAVWKSLGTFFFKPDGTNEVRLSDITSDSWLSVRYDALAWVPRTDSKPPSAEVVAIRDQGAGQFQVVWQGVDDASGVASFDVQVQRDGGEWQDWLTTTPYTNADYLVQDPTPAIYAFRVRARDWAGNTSDFQPEPHMNTSLATQ